MQCIKDRTEYFIDFLLAKEGKQIKTPNHLVNLFADFHNGGIESFNEDFKIINPITNIFYLTVSLSNFFILF
jgi:hypothetical protein